MALATAFAFSSSPVFSYELEVFGESGEKLYTTISDGGKYQLIFDKSQGMNNFHSREFEVQTESGFVKKIKLGEFSEIVINTSSKYANQAPVADWMRDDWGAFHGWGTINLDMPQTKFKINLTDGRSGDNALKFVGWQNSFKAAEIGITTDATNAAAIRSPFGSDNLTVEASVLTINTKGETNAYGIKIAPGKRSPNVADRPRADRYLKFDSTEITMERGGVGVYVGFDDKETKTDAYNNPINYNYTQEQIPTDEKEKAEFYKDRMFYLVTAELGNTTIELKGDPQNSDHGNVGLFSAGLGLIKTQNFKFNSSGSTDSTALKAEVNDTYYLDFGFASNKEFDKQDNTFTFDQFEGKGDSTRIEKTASILIEGNVSIKVSENRDYQKPTSFAADAGKDGIIIINEKADKQFSIQIDGDIRAYDQGASIVVNANSSNSFLTSNVNYDNGGQVTLGLGNNARWNVRGNSHVTQLNALEGNAYVDLTHESGTRNTLVIDDLQGSGKSQLTFVLHSDIKGKNAVGANDKVIIKSAGSETQLHTLHIPSTGEPEGDETSGSYLVYVPQNVSVMLNETHHPDKNVPHRVVDKGLYLYTLASDKDVGTPDEIKTNLREEDKYDGYYLTLAGFTPDNPQGGNNNKPVTPLLSPTAKAVLAMAGMGGQNAMYHNQLSDLRKRLGEVRGMTESNGLWVSASGQRDRFDGFASNGVKQNAYRFNLGLDHKIGSWLIGANFKYLHGTQKTSSPDSHAKGKVNSAGANIYGTWIAENGLYTDIVASFDHYHQKITTSMLDGRGVSGKVNNFGLGLSAEVGKKFGLAKDFFVEPQAQLAYYWIKGKDFSMSNGMKVEQDNFNSLVGRLGLVAGKDFKDAEGNTKGQVFVKGGVKQQFAGKQKLYANSIQFKDELKGTSGYYGLGFEANPNKMVSLYGHLERENGKHYTKEIEVMLGLRYKF